MMRMNNEIETELEAKLYIHDDDGDREYIVYGNYEPEMLAITDHFGVPTDPPVHAMITYRGAEDENGDEVILSHDEEELAVDALWDLLEN